MKLASQFTLAFVSVALTASLAGSCGPVGGSNNNNDGGNGSGDMTGGGGGDLPLVTPSILIISPGLGAIKGGTVINIKGGNFLDGATVTFNGVPGTNVSVVSDVELNVTLPATTAAALGPVPVTVQNPGGGTATNSTLFRYVGAKFDFDSKTPLAVGKQPFAIISTDVNGDNKRDLVTANYMDGNISVLLGNGDGTFAQAANVATAVLPVALVAEDFSGDGKIDLAVACSNGAMQHVTLLVNNGSGGFMTPTYVDLGVGLPNPTGIVAGKFDNNNSIDLAVSLGGAGNVAVLVNNGTGTFTRSTASIGAGQTQPAALLAGDWDNNTRIDLITANFASGALSFLSNNGDATFATPAVAALTVTQPVALAARDFNGDGRLDIVTSSLNGNSLTLLQGKNDGTFQNPTTIAATNAKLPRSVVAPDLDKDGLYDLVAANSGGDTVFIYRNKGAGTFEQTVQLVNTGSQPYAVVVDDFNADGKLDLATANLNDGNVSLFINKSM